MLWKPTSYTSEGGEAAAAMPANAVDGGNGRDHPEAVKADPALYERIGEERPFEGQVIEPSCEAQDHAPQVSAQTGPQPRPTRGAGTGCAIADGYDSARLLTWISFSKYV